MELATANLTLEYRTVTDMVCSLDGEKEPFFPPLPPVQMFTAHNLISENIQIFDSSECENATILWTDAASQLVELKPWLHIIQYSQTPSREFIQK